MTFGSSSAWCREVSAPRDGPRSDTPSREPATREPATRDAHMSDGDRAAPVTGRRFAQEARRPVDFIIPKGDFCGDSVALRALAPDDALTRGERYARSR
jgi:hypothetical protein